MKVTISATWLRLPWSMQTWDRAYQYVIKAGGGDRDAQTGLAHVKIAAQANNPVAQQVKANFDAVAKLVTAGLPKPSEFTRGKLRTSPLLPGQRPGARPGMPGQRPGAPASSAALAATVKRQQEQIKRQREQLAAQQRQQAERAKRGKLMAQAQQRVAALKTAHDVELAQVEDQLAAVEKMLENRNIADEMRKQLEAQAEGYEALIEKLKLPDAVNASEPATETSEAMAAEQVEAEQDDAAEGYPSGVPGDVEFADAGT